MSKKKKLIISLVSIAVAVLLIATLIIALVINNNREKTAKSVMTCSVNPQVQFVLNDKNEVMKVVALNNDGQALTLKVDFVGLEAADAAEMFVKISTDAGYIDPDTTGTAVNFDISGSKKNYDKIKEDIVAKVNAYFDSQGIIAGAIANIQEDFKDAIKTLKPNALNLDDQNQEELMNHYLEITDMIEGIIPNNLEGFYTSYNSLYETLETERERLNTLITEYENKIADLKTQIEGLDENLREPIQAQIEQAEKTIKNIRQGIADAESRYHKSLETITNAAKEGFETFKQNLKTEIESKITAAASKLESHKTYYEANKAAVDAKIAEYRNSLNA